MNESTGRRPLSARTLHLTLAEGIVLVTYVAIVLLTSLQVISRYVIGNSLPWTEELARYCFMWLIYVGMVLALNKGAHACVDILSSRCAGKVKALVQLAVHSIAVALFIVLLVQGLMLFAMVKGQASPAMRISMMIPYASLPFGSLLMIIEELFRIAAIIKGKEDESV